MSSKVAFWWFIRDSWAFHADHGRTEWERGDWRAEQSAADQTGDYSERTAGRPRLVKVNVAASDVSLPGWGPLSAEMPAKRVCAIDFSYPWRKAYALNSTSANRESVNHLRSQ